MKCDFGAPRGAAARRRAAEIKNAGAIVSRSLCTLCLGGKVGEPPWGAAVGAGGGARMGRDQPRGQGERREGARAWGATSPAVIGCKVGEPPGGRWGKREWARALGATSPAGRGLSCSCSALVLLLFCSCSALVLELCCDFFGGRAPRRAWGKTTPCGSGFGAGKRARRRNEIEQW